MALIIGLGNPGRKYTGTRHNIGFEVIDKLSESLSITPRPGKGPFHAGKGERAGHTMVLVKPATFMNNSGTAVQQALNWYKEEPGNCLICYDDLDLEIGTLRLRPGGSAGGHNGVKDIIQKLGTPAFPRLRIGIGTDFSKERQVRFVLSPFTDEERKIVNPVVDKAVDATLCFVREGIDKAMNKFN